VAGKEMEYMGCSTDDDVTRTDMYEKITSQRQVSQRVRHSKRTRRLECPQIKVERVKMQRVEPHLKADVLLRKSVLI
jgi:hypothetical protein